MLSNGWDRAARRKAATRFHLDWEEFQDRHELVVDAFETGRATLDEYLHRTVFYRARRFRREEFRAFMLAQSEPHTGTLALLRRLARTRRYFMATLNNESLDLNLYRIERFRLREYFSAFFSSCFLGVKKPDEAIYHLALRITQRAPEECLFVDDRPLNLESARGCGMRTIHYQGPGQLEEELRRNGVEAGTSRLRPGKGMKRRPPPKPVR